MRRLFLLVDGDDEARELVQRLRAQALLQAPIKLTAATRRLTDELSVRRGSIEEFTGVRMGRRRGMLAGAVLGGAVSLVGLLAPEGALPLSPATAILLAAIGGAALGLAIGTIAGAAQRHPIYEAHAEALAGGAMLMAIEVRAADVDAVVAAIREVRADLPIQARTITDEVVNLG